MSDELYNEIISFLFNENEQGDIQLSFTYFKEMFEYTTMGGKGTRGRTVSNTYRHLSGLNCVDHKLRQAQIIGYCIEILQASFLVHDDIMDNSELRRQKPCWYLKAKAKGFGLIAINDGLFLNTVVHKILMEYFHTESYYADLVGLFNDVIHRTCTGQCLDMLTSPDVIDLSTYTKERYEAIVRWKTAYYSFCLPVVSGLIIAEIQDKSLVKKSEKILMKIGEYFQIQDDFLDCYGDSVLIGKIGRDIEEGKCSWLIVQALSLANEIQLKELKENYGKEDFECVNKIKKIFNNLELEQLYHEYEDNVYAEINAMISTFHEGEGAHLPMEIFTDLLNILYKRVK